MKKIMFNDKYGLTQAVLEGRKTMTRRIIKAPRTMEGKDVYGISVVKYPHTGLPIEVMALDAELAQINNILPKFKVGEIVAVAQSYESIRKEMLDGHHNYFDDVYEPFHCGNFISGPGYHNKMFVRADLMPHRIRITNIRVERLQDISEDDVYREGFAKQTVNNGWGNAAFHWEAMLVYYDSLGRTKELRSPDARDAFATLIDKVSGNGTWDRNPWVFVYEFELI